MHLLGRIRRARDRLRARLALVGADPRDDEDLAARKALLVLISVLILPVGASWGALYLAFGSPVGVVPLLYFGILFGAIAVFSRTRDFSWLLRVGQVDILLAPTLSMIPLGGFLDSGGVGLWGILAPLGALVFSDVGPAARWYVGYLDHLFSHFDELAERYGLEKIKTIGDCYMVAAGVPTPRPDHARAVALMALDMLEAMRSADEVAHLGLELRIGINSGPVVAGVIGRKRFLYDLWGDAVNTASRMESHGTRGQIQVTRATYELLKDQFELVPRGTVAIKGKGEVEKW